MMPLSRRQILTGAGLGITGILAGCGGLEDDTRDPQSTEIPTDSPITETGFDGTDLVVSLQDDHSVSRVNLIDPEGSLYRGADVAVGETTVRLKILDIRPGVGGYEHYEPGTYELVAVEGEDSSSVTVELEPDIRVVDVQQYRDGEYASDLGKLAVTVENIGTGPTWVYNITYDNSPNSNANIPLETDPGFPQIIDPRTSGELIIPPGDERTFVSSLTPNLFRTDMTPDCTGSASYSIVLGIASGGNLTQPVNVRFEGDPESIGIVGQHTCTDIDVQVVD
jgi:hypothetical protein